MTELVDDAFCIQRLVLVDIRTGQSRKSVVTVASRRMTINDRSAVAVETVLLVLSATLINSHLAFRVVAYVDHLACLLGTPRTAEQSSVRFNRCRGINKLILHK